MPINRMGIIGGGRGKEVNEQNEAICFHAGQ